MKLTGHLCSVTLGEAADLGIDDIEHAFMAATDFVADKQPDVCPGQATGQQTIAALDPNGEPFKALVQKLVSHHVTLTSTMTVFETFTPGRPLPQGLDTLLPDLRMQFLNTYIRTSAEPDVALQDAVSERHGARSRVREGRRPARRRYGSHRVGRCHPGYSDQREIELFVEAGFTPLEAIRICTLNGAKYLGRDATIGSIAVGKQADLVVLNGDPTARIADIRKVETVFKAGVGFDPEAIVKSVTGKVGLW